MTEPIARIEAALTRLGAEHEPPPGWQARVLAATAARRRRPWWLSWMPAIAIPGLAITAWFVLPVIDRGAPGREPELAIAFSRSGAAYRGGSREPTTAYVDDTVHATATARAAHRALWIYRDNALVADCPRDPRCRTSRGTTTLDVVLSAVGRWAIVAVSSTTPIAAPSGSYDADLSTAQNARAAIDEKLVIVQ